MSRQVKKMSDNKLIIRTNIDSNIIKKFREESIKNSLTKYFSEWENDSLFIEIEMIYGNNVTICLIKMKINGKDIFFRGVSKLYEGDVYNKKVGEKNAYRKAFNKIKEKFNNMMKTYNLSIIYLLSNIEKTCDYNVNKIFNYKEV